MNNPLRVVLDTNVLISATLKQNPSIPGSIFQALADQRFILLTSPSIVAEVEDVINREEIVRRSSMTTKERRTFIENILEISLATTEKVKVEAVKDDPDDDKFVACAVEGQADFIVSGDKHVLALKEYQGIKIVSPREFLNHLK